MSKVIYVCTRNRRLGSTDEDRLREICRNLEPDNVVSQIDHKVLANDRIAFAIMNYQPSIIEKENSLLLGCLYGQWERWDEPLTDFPDGSYALFRDNDDYFEVVTDAAASRTIWYYFDEHWFIASTSQRAMVMFLGSFDFDERVIPWCLSTGSLGPELSWDQRFKRLAVDSSVVLDRAHWSISTKHNPVRFAEQNRSDAEHNKLLAAAISKTIESLQCLNFDDWALPLSGGYDSRAILCFTNKTGAIPENLRTITWGLEKSIRETGNDAKVAKDLADRMGVAHRYYHTDVSDEPIAKIIDRFLLCGEGRADGLSGYMDGMKIWSDLLADGVVGIIRGDEGFGWSAVSSAMTVRCSVGCGLCSDYSNLVDVIDRFGLPDQEFPADLQQTDESLSAWRDRLYHTYRIPTILAALSDIKYSYVEQITPLLSRLILSRVRELPDRLRTDKSLFKEIVNTIAPRVPYANKEATASADDILRKGPVVELLYHLLRSEYARTVFSSEFLIYITKGITREGSSSKMTSGSVKKYIKKLIPRSIKNVLRDTGVAAPSADANRLAFRVYMIVRMHQILSEDCNKFSS